MQSVITCKNCGAVIVDYDKKCPNCSDGNVEERTYLSPSKRLFMVRLGLQLIKHPLIKYPLLSLAVIFVLGIAVQVFFNDCNCSFQSCRGCGGIIGNMLARFSNYLLASSVLLLWLGTPIIIFGLIFTVIYNLLVKNDKSK